jgi:hypothetical protein
MSTPDPPPEKKKGSKQKTGIEVKQASYGANGAFTDVKNIKDIFKKIGVKFRKPEEGHLSKQ